MGSLGGIGGEAALIKRIASGGRRSASHLRRHLRAGVLSCSPSGPLSSKEAISARGMLPAAVHFNAPTFPAASFSGATSPRFLFVCFLPSWRLLAGVCCEIVLAGGRYGVWPRKNDVVFLTAGEMASCPRFGRLVEERRPGKKDAAEVVHLAICPASPPPPGSVQPR